jgi:diguanylate cyclase (GGDEF)-like protein
MRFQFSGFAGGRLASAATLSAARPSGSERIVVGQAGRLWSVISTPFHRSIRIRFQYAFGFAIFGLVLMAAITLASGCILLNTYENSVSEARFELLPAHRLEVSLREAEHLTYLYAIEGDRSARSRFKEVEETVNNQFRKLTENGSQFGSVEHAHSDISLPGTIKAWQDARAAVFDVFRYDAGTAEAIEALKRAHMAIDPVYDVSARFHHGAMQDLQERLRFAHAVANWAYSAIIGAILLGLGVLIATGFVVGRSVLLPIAELQRAARKLGRKDFSHRVKLRNTRDELGQLGKAFNVASISLERLYGELERRSSHDGLTGVFNRAAFDERLLAECKSADRHGRALSLLMVDIDFFKRVNDNYGHQTGDRVLETLARLLNESIRPGDVVARFGGEEFVVIFPETAEEAAMAMAERIRRTIGDHSFECSNGEDIGITVSIGCASRWADAVTCEELVKEADAALYRAKNAGRNRVVSARDLPSPCGLGCETAAA